MNLLQEDNSLIKTIREDFLRCKICSNIFDNPKILPCVHTYCSDCVDKLLDTSDKSRSVSCPECRADFSLSSSSDLRTNVLISHLVDIHKGKTSDQLQCTACDLKGNATPAETRCLDCGDYLCSDCSRAHNASSTTWKHKKASLEDIKKGLYDKDLRNLCKLTCSEHHDKVLEYFCINCKIPICLPCVIHVHTFHKTIKAIDMVSLQKNRLSEHVVKVKTKAKELKMEKKRGYDNIANVYKLKYQAITNIEKQTNNVISKIECCKEKALTIVEKKTSEMFGQCKEHIDNTKLKITATRSCLEFCDRLMNEGKDEEFLYLEEIITNRLQQLEFMPHVDIFFDERSSDFNDKNSEEQILKSQLQKVVSKMVEELQIGFQELQNEINKIQSKTNKTVQEPNTDLNSVLKELQTSVQSTKKDLKNTRGEPNISVHSTEKNLHSMSDQPNIGIHSVSTDLQNMKDEPNTSVGSKEKCPDMMVEELNSRDQSTQKELEEVVEKPAISFVSIPEEKEMDDILNFDLRCALKETDKMERKWGNDVQSIQNEFISEENADGFQSKSKEMNNEVIKPIPDIQPALNEMDKAIDKCAIPEKSDLGESSVHFYYAPNKTDEIVSKFDSDIQSIPTSGTTDICIHENQRKTDRKAGYHSSEFHATHEKDVSTGESGSTNIKSQLKISFQKLRAFECEYEKDKHQPVVKSMAVNNNMIVLSDSANREIKIFTTVGIFKRCLLSHGHFAPSSVAVSNNVIGAIHENQLHLFNEMGEPAEIIQVSAVPSTGSRFPYTLTSYKDEEFIVGNLPEGVFRFYRTDGTLRKEIEMSLDYPLAYFSVSSNGHLVTCEWGDRCVRVRDIRGNILTRCQVTSTWKPTAAHEDEKGYIYALDSFRATISVFDNNGIYITHHATNPDGLLKPVDLAFEARLIYLVNTLGNINVYNINFTENVFDNKPVDFGHARWCQLKHSKNNE